jgi:hypothetical protein
VLVNAHEEGVKRLCAFRGETPGEATRMNRRLMVLLAIGYGQLPTHAGALAQAN